jgi:oxygen-independent coproporphyrinogen-3 oxidase
MAVGSHHLYIHVPFCRLVCAYCDFVTVGGRADDVPGYVDALLVELALRPAPGELRTIYFGGGTPSLLSPDQVARIIGAARERWTDADLVEVTLEANPGRREAPDWRGLRAAGVTRISLGAQSLRDDDLATLARGHDAAEVREAAAAVRRAGFDSLSLDLIYGIPGQSLDGWRAGLEAAIQLAPDHLSCYALQLVLSPDEWAAPPRPGAIRWRRRMAPLQDDGLAAAQYGLAEELLAAAGYEHYELSSWARPGHESRHNAAYWARLAYTGIGAGAHSFDGAATRSWNVADLDAYLRAVDAGTSPVGGSESLDSPTRAFEAVALGLRRVRGLRRSGFGAEFGPAALAQFDVAAAEGRDDGLLEVDGDWMRLTAAGRLLASEACLAFLPAEN